MGLRRSLRMRRKLSAALCAIQALLNPLTPGTHTLVSNGWRHPWVCDRSLRMRHKLSAAYEFTRSM